MILVGSILAGMISFICGEPGVSLLGLSMTRSSPTDDDLAGAIPRWLPNDEPSSVRHVRFVLRRDAEMFRKLHLVSHVPNSASRSY